MPRRPRRRHDDELDPGSKFLKWFIAVVVGGAVTGLASTWGNRVKDDAQNALLSKPSEPPTHPQSNAPRPAGQSAGKPPVAVGFPSVTAAPPQNQPQAPPPGLENARNLLVNGGFEDGPETPADPTFGFVALQQGSTAVQGWVVTRGSIDYQGSYWQHAEGKRSVDLNGQTAGGIAQTFRTVRGRTYRVVFSLAGNAYRFEPSLKKMAVSAANASTDFEFDTTGKNYKEMGWVMKQWDFTAISEETTLEFSSRTQGISGPAIDNVWVVELAE